MGTLIIAATGEQAREYSRRLLAAADDPAQVQTVTHIEAGAVGFEVPDDVADRAGFGEAADDGPADETPEPAPTEEIPVVVVDDGPADETPEPAPTEEIPVVVVDGRPFREGDEPPARNASRASWAAFLDNQPVPVKYPADAGRDDLLALWDSLTAE